MLRIGAGPLEAKGGDSEVLRLAEAIGLALDASEPQLNAALEKLCLCTNGSSRKRQDGMPAVGERVRELSDRLRRFVGQNEKGQQEEAIEILSAASDVDGKCSQASHKRHVFAGDGDLGISGKGPLMLTPAPTPKAHFGLDGDNDGLEEVDEANRDGFEEMEDTDLAESSPGHRNEWNLRGEERQTIPPRSREGFEGKSDRTCSSGERKGIWIEGRPGLDTIPEDITKNIATLEKITLVDCALKRFPKLFGDAKMLQTLQIENTQMTGTLPPVIWKLNRLVTLRLNRNRLTGLCPQIRHLVCLKHLEANSNEIVALPPELQYLTMLQTLSVDNNKLCFVPDEVRHLKNLRTLSVRGNRLNCLPDGVQQLQKLRNVYLSNNPMKLIPTCLASLPLEHLELKNCMFSNEFREKNERDHDFTLTYLKEVYLKIILKKTAFERDVINKFRLGNEIASLVYRTAGWC
mmetsp:Transcript_30715/g.74845  ORF Transcript_30715/g.74845 Transcript_30715/m.74845 type:complete len:462 (+) Transcript_30715:195-1580(+)